MQISGFCCGKGSFAGRLPLKEQLFEGQIGFGTQIVLDGAGILCGDALGDSQILQQRKQHK